MQRENGATFALPSPDPDIDGVTDYSVFARALGRPGGSADMTSCAQQTTDTDGNGILDILDTDDPANAEIHLTFQGRVTPLV